MNDGPVPDADEAGDWAPQHAAVWRLLGEAPLPPPDPWFATRTLALCREDKKSALSWMRLRRWLLSGGLALAGVFLLAQVQMKKEIAQQKNVREAFEIMASVEGSNEPDNTAPTASWQDSSL